MTREFDDSRHFHEHTQPTLTWDQVYVDERYERTSHNFGMGRVTGGISFNVGGAQVNLGYGDRHRHSHHGHGHRREYDGYGNEYNGDRAYQTSYYANEQFYSRPGYSEYRQPYSDRYSDSDYGYVIERPETYSGRYYSSRTYEQYYAYETPVSRGRYQPPAIYADDLYAQYRNPNAQYGEQYYGRSGYQNDYYSGNEWIRMRSTLQSMLGRSPREFNRNVPEDLGCATIVSAALRRAHGVNINDTSVKGLEQSLRRNGYEAIPIQYAKPGDCIIAHRGGGRHGHAAIYVGDGKVVNNSSAQGRVVVAPLKNFASRDYQTVVAYRRV